MARELQEARIRFQIIGNTERPAAYKVAAGVINPVTGRWMTKSWEIDRLLPAARTTYEAIEQAFDIKIYHPLPLLRYCQNADDAKRLGRRMRNPRYANVLGRYIPPSEGHPDIEDTQGSFEINHAAYVDLPLCLETLQTDFRQQGVFQDTDFQHVALHKTADGWSYENIQAKRVIFCEGIGLSGNPWFKYLPFSPAKGETLILESDGFELPHTLYHHKKWILPYGYGRFRVGATYDESDLSPEPTTAGRKELLGAVQAFIRPEVDWQIQSHLAGIRPCTPDAKPLLGTHSKEASLHLLNGLGSKGASLAPLMCRKLFAHIFNQATLDPEIDLRRFDAPCD